MKKVFLRVTFKIKNHFEHLEIDPADINLEIKREIHTNSIKELAFYKTKIVKIEYIERIT